MVGDLMMKNMDWPGSEEIAKRLQAMLPPQLQPSADGTKANPQVIQAQQMMEQMANQMEQMSQQISALNIQNKLLVGDKEREWYDAQTKRMDVEGKLMMTDAQLQAAVKDNLMLMISQGTAEVMENNQELEQIEVSMDQMQAQAMAQQAQQRQQAQGQGASMAGPSVGGMTRKADTSALTGDTKPGESENE
jgi:tRNA(Met) C34 N-acetyltransferase TmcA